MSAFEYRAVLKTIEENPVMSEEVRRDCRKAILFTARKMGTPLEYEERIDFAVPLILKGLCRAVVCERMCTAFGVCKSTAYTAYAAAVEFSKKRPDFWKKDCCNRDTGKAANEQGNDE